MIAWGALVMGVGHLHMQTEHFFGVNLFASVLGGSLGAAAWILALAVTWALTGVGFYSIYKASREA